jgi:glycerate kinase
MHILIAPNAFKNSLDANHVAEAIQQGLVLSRLECTSECFPIADGGDGTGNLIVERCKGKIITKQVHDPLGRKIKAFFGLIECDKTAVIEMANASGLRLMERNELDPMRASSYGTGELIKEALDKGVNKVVIAMGGSATVDGGCGILRALGIVFLDEKDEPLLTTPRDLLSMAKVDTSALDKRIFDCEVAILCDVNNTLLGPDGAANVFGPQKGASEEDVAALEQFLENFAAISEKQTGKNMANVKHGGAAGGAAAGLHTWINAKLVDGIEYFLSLTHFDDALNKSNLVITGEGSIDKQTLQGKGPYGVAVKAKAKNIPVIALAGKVPLKTDSELQQYFDVLLSINNEPCELADAMANTEANLVRMGKEIGNMIALRK